MTCLIFKKKSQELPKKQINQLDINKSQNNFNENSQIKNQEPILMERSRQAHSKKNIMSLNSAYSFYYKM